MPSIPQMVSTISRFCGFNTILPGPGNFIDITGYCRVYALTWRGLISANSATDIHDLILANSSNVCRSLGCRISATIEAAINRSPLRSMGCLAGEKYFIGQ
ncbi:MAG: hypothetical protein QF485_06705, partial [Arenicellales bacterium]|nr:hypothetical protein [Arenicellales bacterium]